jgi:tRNA G10  N-methylase Trm11
MFIAVALVGIKTLDFNQEILQVILGYITNYKRCILIQNLVSFAGLWENIDTIPTIQSLSLLFGSVNHAITNYIPETKKSEITRFIYTPKASKKERNRGCEGLEEHNPCYESHRPNYKNTKGIETPYAGTGRTGNKLKNNHPTVKPLSLMKYLVTLTKMPNPEQVYLDPFCGSGTTLMACKELGCNYIGIDKEPEYCEIAKCRVNATPEPECGFTECELDELKSKYIGGGE